MASPEDAAQDRSAGPEAGLPPGHPALEEAGSGRGPDILWGSTDDDQPAATPDADDTSDDGADSEALAELLGLADDSLSQDADDAGDDGTSRRGQANGSRKKSWEDMTDDEIEEAKRTLTPAEVRKQFRFHGEYTRSRQELADERRARADERTALEARMQALESRQATPPPPQQQGPQAPASLLDCFEPNEDGEMFLSQAKVKQWETGIREDSLRAAREEVAPIKQTLTQREEADQQRQRDAELEVVLQKVGAMEKAFPHFARSEAVQQAVIEHMKAYGITDPVAAYASKYPLQYADTISRFQRARSQQRNQTPRPPAMAPGTARGEAAPPSVHDRDFDGRTADIVAKEMGMPRR